MVKESTVLTIRWHTYKRSRTVSGEKVKYVTGFRKAFLKARWGGASQLMHNSLIGWWWGNREVSEFSSVQSLSYVRLFVIPWTAAHQASLSITNSWSLLKLMYIELVMPFNHLILCHPLILLPSTFPNFRVFSNELVLPIRWPKYWRFSFSISPSNEHLGLISFMMDWFDLLAQEFTSLGYQSLVSRWPGV